MIAVRESLADDAEAMRELFRLFRESREMGGDGSRSAVNAAWAGGEPTESRGGYRRG